MITDPLLTVKSILSNNWNSSNTENIKPRFFENKSIKEILSIEPVNDTLTFYKLASTQTTNSLGTASREWKDPVTIDIVTMKSREHLLLMVNEVDRIISAKIIIPDSNYDILDPDGTSQKDWSDTYKGIFRWTYDIILIKSNESR